MISEYKRILWQATSSLIIDLSSLASFFYPGMFFLPFLIRILFATQMPSCNVYLLDLTKTKENLFCQILAASGLYSDLVVEIVNVFMSHCQKIFKWQNFRQTNFCYSKKMGSYCVQTDPLQPLPVSSSFRHMTQKGPSFRLCTQMLPLGLCFIGQRVILLKVFNIVCLGFQSSQLFLNFLCFFVFLLTVY